MSTDREWTSIKPQNRKFEQLPANDFTGWSNDGRHTTNIRRGNSLGAKIDSKNNRSDDNKTTEHTRKTRREQMTTVLSDWKTHEFSDDVEGPGMKSGPIQPIGSDAERGPWAKRVSTKDAGKDISLTEPFIGLNRKPRATRLPISNKDLRDAKTYDDEGS